MLPDARGILQRLLHDNAQQPLDRQIVDVTFEAPTEEWIAARTQPTLNLFLFDVQENTELRNATPQRLPLRDDGRSERRLPPRRFDLWYMVSALTHDSQDEERLLWHTLGILLRYPHLPTLASGDDSAPAPVVTGRLVRSGDGPRLLDLWDRLGTRPHPALCYAVTVPLDLEITGSDPLVLSRTTRVTSLTTDGGPERRTPRSLCGCVRDALGVACAGLQISSDEVHDMTRANGYFVLHNIPFGSVTLHLTTLEGRQIRLVVEHSEEIQMHEIVLTGEGEVLRPRD